MEELDDVDDVNDVNGETSEAEDLLLSDTEDIPPPEQDVSLRIDYNGRIMTKELNCENTGDDCDMQFVAKNLLPHRASDAGFHTSTEDLNVSDDDEKSNVLAPQSVNLDGIASTSSKKNTGSLSTLNYSHSVFKNEYSIDVVSDEETSDMKANFTRKDKDKTLLPGLTAAGLSSGVKMVSSAILPPRQKVLNSLNIKNVFANTLLLDEDASEIQDEQESPPMTCLEFLKAELSDGNHTDAEDISVGSLDDIGEISRKDRNHSGRVHSAVSLSANDKRFGGSRRSSTALTEDETFTMENIPNHSQKRVKKRNFRISDKNDKYEGSDGSEWTETDDSGGVRQITQIKTETSIQLEGEGAVRSLKKVPKKEPSDERKSSTDSEQEDLSFSEKKSMFQRLSLTSDTLPKGNKWTQEVSLDDLPMAHGEIVQEQISFEDKLKMFEPDEGNRKRIQKRDKPDQPTVYRYDFTKLAKEKPTASEFMVSELEKAEEIVKQVKEELSIEEDSLNDPHFDLSEQTQSKSDQCGGFTLEKVEQEVSSLLAEVDKEEKQLSNDLRRVSCSRTDSDKSSNINSRIFDMESEKGNGSSDYAALSPDVVQENMTAESYLAYSEVDVTMQDGEKVTVYESKISDTDKKSLDEQCVELTTELEAEDYVTTKQDEPIVESPSRMQFEQTPENIYNASTDEVTVYTITEEDAGRKLSVDMLKKEEFKEALKLDEDDSEHENLIHADRPSKLLDISSTVDSHIKSEILREEIDQSIEESPLEVKQIAEDLENISSSEDHKCNVYKHIRTEIFTQVLGEDIESGSPERKEISVLSPKRDSGVDEEICEEHDLVDESHLDQEKSGTEDVDGTLDAKLCSDDDDESKHKDLSPQISEESACHTDEMSSEGIVVEHDDDHLVEYEEALGEHSLTEQLQALASDVAHPGLVSSDLQTEFESYDIDFKASAMSSSMSDLEIHRRSKDLYARHDKKDIRSLKSTKQVSTIEEHSSIESCDSPQELIRQEIPEKSITSEIFEKQGKPDIFVEKQESTASLDSIKSELTETKTSEEINDECVEEKHALDAEAYDKVEEQFKQLNGSHKTDRLSRSDSKSSQGKKSDSDEGSKGESTVDSSGKRKEESCSSSGETESPYYSVETSDSGRTPRSTPAASRPCSSEFDINVFSGQGSEYETCVTSQEASGEASGSYMTAISSQEISYATACSSFSHSSRESAYSVDSESSGHLASVEISSEASETLVPSAQEMELEFGPDLEMPVLDEEPSSEEAVKEPYDMDIPESVIRGGIEMPFMKTWSLKDPVPDSRDVQLPQQWSWQYAAESEVLDKFEVLESHENISDPQNYSSLPIANIETVESCSSQITTVTDPAKCFTQVETVSSVHEGPGHRRSHSSVFDIIPDRERVEPVAPIEEEQQSVSESSATHSEQTWQTNSVDTAVQLSSQAPASCIINESSSLFSASDSFQETPPEKELTSEQSTSGLQPESYLQLNGPVEVDYNPDYDNPDADNSELNHEPQVQHYEVDGLQFDLEIDGTFNNIPNGASAPNGVVAAVNSFSDNIETEDSNESAVPGNYPIHSSSEYESHTTGVSSDAEKPEAQQEQSLSFNEYGARETESLVCPDLTSYLPESDQCDLLSVGDSLPPSYESEVNIPCSESLNSNELPAENRSQLLPDLQSTDSMERTDVVDTSPEDERYEYKSVRPSSSEKYTEEKDLENMSSLLKSDEGDILAESDYVPPSYTSKYDEPPITELYTHHEEEEFDLRESDVYPSPIPSIEDDKQSTPSSDVLLHSRRFFPRSGETSAASSLQEFERLEAEIAAGRLSRSSVDSSEKMAITKSGEHDDVSMSSLTEFEKLERECVDNESGDKITDDIMLSEIEEGLESQCSDALEILPESLHEGSDTSEYERRRLDFEEIIKVAQSNVEKFQEETLSDAVTSDECTVLMRAASEAQDTSEGTKVSSKEECTTDAEESEPLPITLEADTVGGHDSSSSGEKNYENGKGDCMVSSTDSIDPSSSTATHATYQFETDSVMSSSINSAQASGEECTMVSSTDTLEPEPKLTYSHGDLSSDERAQASSTDSFLKKGSLACKLDELKELETTNGAKEQMEMFLSKLTDESVLMEEFPPHSFSDTVDDSEHHTTSDDLLKSCEAAQGFSMSGDDLGLDDDIISRTTTTTTRIVTTVTTDGEEESHEEQVVEESGDDLRHSVEVILNQFMSSDSDATKPEDSTTEHDE